MIAAHAAQPLSFSWLGSFSFRNFIHRYMRMHSLTRLAVGWGLVALATVARAAEADLNHSMFDLSLAELADIRVVTAASGYEQNLLDAPASVSVIEAEEWEENGARTLDDAIRSLPGVHLTKVQTGVTKDRISLRGLSGSFGQQVLVLVDGTPINHSYDGGVFFGNRIPLLGFQRIEVVKGPGSAIYGADAFGGVVNLVSYAPGTAPSQWVVRAGAFNTWEAGFTHDMKIGNSTLQLAYEYQRSDDDTGKVVKADLQSLFDSIFGTKVSEAPGRIDEHYAVSSLSARWRWKKLSFDVYDWRNLGAGLGAGVAQALDPRGHSQESSTTYKLGVDLSSLATGQLDFHLMYRAESLQTRYNIFPPGTVLPIGADGNINFAKPVNLVTFSDGYIGAPGNGNRTYSADLTHLFELGADHRVRWAFGYDLIQLRASESKNFGPSILNGTQLIVNGKLTSTTGTAYNYVPDTDRKVWYLSLQDEWKITPALRATAGIRHDQYSDFGGTTNPRFGLNYDLAKDVVLKLSAGTAFRAPAFADLYSSNNPAGLGNPALLPETIRTVEAGISAILPFAPQLQLDVSVFHYEAKQLIAFVLQPATGVQLARNVGTRRGQGFEFSGRWQVAKGLSADFNYSYVNEKNEWGQPQPDVPRQMAYLGVHWQSNHKYHAMLGAKWVADRTRATGDARPPIRDYVWGSARLERRFDHLSISLSVENLFNVDAREPSNGTIPDDYPLAGLQWIMETTWKF